VRWGQFGPVIRIRPLDKVMAIAPIGCKECADYIMLLLDNYISENSKFPPYVWSECSNSRYTKDNKLCM